MATPATPLTAITTDTATLIGHLKAAAEALSTEAKIALTQALADAHQEFVDVQGSGTSIWSALLAAIKGTPAPIPPAPAPTQSKKAS